MKKTDKGFTLVELLVTIGIISVLLGAAVAVIRPLDYIKRSRDTRRISDLKVIQTAIEQYYGNENGYPPSSGTGTPPVTTGGAWTYNTITYLTNTPVDPKNSGTYVYYYAKDLTCGGTALTGAYILCANLENSTGTCQLPSPAFNYCVINPF